MFSRLHRSSNLLLALSHEIPRKGINGVCVFVFFFFVFFFLFFFFLASVAANNLSSVLQNP